eukprot:SAG31_NODE_1991_length_6712_cov_6.411311_1_plen_40_part_10
MMIRVMMILRAGAVRSRTRGSIAERPGPRRRRGAAAARAL